MNFNKLTDAKSTNKLNNFKPKNSSWRKLRFFLSILSIFYPSTFNLIQLYLLLIHVTKEINRFIISFIFTCCLIFFQNRCWLIRRSWIRRHLQRTLCIHFFHWLQIFQLKSPSDHNKISRTTEKSTKGNRKKMIAMESGMIMRRWYTLSCLHGSTARLLYTKQV